MKPRIITITRRGNRSRTSIRKSGEEFAKESRWQFLIELLLFGLLIAISTWPIIDTAEALRAL